MTLNQNDFDEIEKLVRETVQEEIRLLPSKDEFFSNMDKVLGELKALRDEVTIVNHQYDRTNKRVDKIDKHLNISTTEI
ncbi:hypothetical protein HY045_03840 [Candidatus Woesebacteria bacterium]|nr:hypothetical protein [Candidatus Woesebacteria bacterium]